MVEQRSPKPLMWVRALLPLPSEKEPKSVDFSSFFIGWNPSDPPVFRCLDEAADLLKAIHHSLITISVGYLEFDRIIF